ncbi:hypothetical protein CROQUDRAFT_657915 [Cronartium quercuum f. sp. fusiforme G11]|uniref:Uncharacterized protein n=1 Tax=Cronartium quercuum f. sp. fusiforme G11 TaxID=708437 RepID=A0A9P6TB82_9BASI|nr:hypothetical protein CROQUDRAFT_657915 [Cronartium quercuum f. sp. fusiforme G11]
MNQTIKLDQSDTNVETYKLFSSSSSTNPYNNLTHHSLLQFKPILPSFLNRIPLQPELNDDERRWLWDTEVDERGECDDLHSHSF